MDRNSVNWAGPMPAITTPFTAQGAIDEQSFMANVDRLYEAGSTGMITADSTLVMWATTRFR